MRLRDAILAILGIAVMAAAGQDARLSLRGSEEQQASELRQSGDKDLDQEEVCLLYTSPSPRDVEESRMPSSA